MLRSVFSFSAPCDFYSPSSSAFTGSQFPSCRQQAVITIPLLFRCRCSAALKKTLSINNKIILYISKKVNSAKWQFSAGKENLSYVKTQQARTFLKKSTQKTFPATRRCVNLNVPAYFFYKKSMEKLFRR